MYQNGWYGSLYCFNKYDGTLIWTYDVEDSVFLNAMPAPFIDPIDEKPVFVFGSASTDSGYWAIKDDGPFYTELWVSYFPGSVYYDGTAAILGDYIIVGDRFNADLFIIDKFTGELEQTYPAAGRITAQVAIAFDRLVIATDDSVECYM